jgi:hypothetical protein
VLLGYVVSWALSGFITLAYTICGAALFGLMGAVVTHSLFVNAKDTWFYLASYTMTATAISVRCPIGGRTCTIAFCDVTSIETRTIVAPTRRTAAKRCHVLVSRSGERIVFSEALQIWREILNRCPNVSTEL